MMASRLLPIATVWVPVRLLRVHPLSFLLEVRWGCLPLLLRATEPGAGGRGRVPGDACSLVRFCIRLVRRAVGSWFLSYRGVPGAWWWEGRRGCWPGLVRASLWRRKTRQPSPTTSPGTPPQPRPGQARSRWEPAFSASPANALGLHASSSSPEARETASGSWMGQMAGARLGGTAEWWEVGSGHLARPLATQLFSPHGGWEWPQQQAEAKLRGEEDRGCPHPGGNQPKGKNQAVPGSRVGRPWASRRLTPSLSGGRIPKRDRCLAMPC